MRDSGVSAPMFPGQAGRQDLIRGDGTAASNSNTALTAAAVQTASLVTTYPIDVTGCATLRALLKPTTLTGTVTATIQPALNDGVSPDTTVAAVAITMALNTLNAASLTLTGHRIALLVVTTSAASTVQFGLAEFVAK
jgi:hypothetical protein